MMLFRREIDGDLYVEYREAIRSEHMFEALRSGTTIVVALNTLFILFDLWVFPEQFFTLLGIRLAWNAVLIAFFFNPFPSDDTAKVLIGLHLTGLGLVVIIAGAGGLDSGYAPGLMLLFLGMPVLVPMSAGQAARIVSLSLFALGTVPVLSGAPIDYRVWGMNMFFPTAAAIECIASCAVLEGMRIADFLQRREVQQARDELAELDRAKSRFSANVHHELRTPLTLILAPLDAIRSGSYGEVSGLLSETVETMHTNGRRLFKLISNLLDLSKLESRLFEIHRAPVDLHELAGDLVTAARGMAERKGIELDMAGFEGLRSINADASAIEKILTNLVGNALKFTPAGGQIHILGEVSPEGVLIHIRDTGAGIPPDQLEAIFDRFAQVDASATRSHEGTGIGLSLALELAQLHGGDIRAHSEGPGMGSTMTVSLPVGEADAGSIEDVIRSDSESAMGLGHSIESVEAELKLDDRVSRNDEIEPGEGARCETESEVKLGEILVAEDNPDMRRLFVSLLSPEYHVRTARNGREALEEISRSMPDLLLSDVMMPEMSGIELCSEVRRMDSTRSLPVVLVTSKAENEIQVEGLELGADDYITKPFYPRALLARVRTLVRVRGLQKELSENNETLRATLDDLKRAEAQLIQSERLAAVGELAAGIAHEVNNPVNFALNAARALDLELEAISELVAAAADLPKGELASDDPRFTRLRGAADPNRFQDLSETVHELLDMVKSGLERTHSLVSDLRDLAAPGRNINPLPNADIALALRSTIQLVRSTMTEAGVEINLTVEEGLPMISADAGALNQIFLNLVKNAADAVEAQRGVIELRVKYDDDRIYIAVKDNGAGIPEEIIPRLFEPFCTTKAAGQGTGLGLSISRKIAENHLGSLELEHTGSDGSTFITTLPITRA